MKDRIFIVGPPRGNPTDRVHVVARTRHREPLLDIYIADDYEEIGREDSLEAAKAMARQHGAVRPTVI